MNEYKIHQRFFAKLKQKAEKKRKDFEDQTMKEDKENIQKREPHRSPEHPQRKRSVPSPEKRVVINNSVAVEKLEGAAVSNGISLEVKETGTLTSVNSSLENEVSPSEEMMAKKRIKIANSVDVGVNSSINNSGSSRSHIMGNGGENCYDGGISLAQFLAETLHSQASEEKQISPQEDEPKEVDAVIVQGNKEKDQEEIQKQLEQGKALQEEREKNKRREEELTSEREKERERQLEMTNTTAHGKYSSEVKQHSKGHKDHEQHNIQASISSMLHSVKDFLFGKSKKDSRDHSENKDMGTNYSNATVEHPHSEMPPSFRLYTEHNPEVCKPVTEDALPIGVDKTEEQSISMDLEQQSASLNCEENALHADEPLDYKIPHETTEQSAAKSTAGADDAVEAMEVSVEPESNSVAEDKRLSGPQIHTEVSRVVSIPC